MRLPDLTGKTVIVTGGNSGIGFASCLALAKQNANVILASRDRQRGETAAQEINDSLGKSNVTTMQLDVAQFASIRKFVDEFLARNEPLHILINNAGIHLPGGWSESPEQDGQRTPEGFEVTLGTNYFGPLMLTQLLLPKLKESAPARIVNLGSPGEQFSGGVYWDDLKGEKKTKSDMNVYGTSKIYLIMASKALNERLKGTGVEVFAAHPGITNAPLYAKTDKSKPMGASVALSNAIGGQPTERGTSPILYAAAAKELDGKGGAFIGGPTGPLLPFSNLDQFKDRPTFTEEGKHLEDCLRLYDETLKIINA
ncbi:NAD(P)-binding protein [Coccomyxa subellipsoidea C-169]|uniref:NAD(P)-binding protein n=1 Tax=Coccomyxa subellipsoidea (strain C-169) TaxID=574566 RepID=I0YQ35_COCSC|nr:NAD(P)-binding protein [Coccomyxa subellipsoidea C-169]EIE20504.1 NAD(P)-binding protein [Coccomyxa subellipsoidea C-169]|eukprot:XP_005645048.1 NAD(P)-binding protein [Coccomyxa subellipsoidea C-169]